MRKSDMVQKLQDREVSAWNKLQTRKEYGWDEESIKEARRQWVDMVDLLEELEIKQSTLGRL